MKIGSFLKASWMMLKESGEEKSFSLMDIILAVLHIKQTLKAELYMMKTRILFQSRNQVFLKKDLKLREISRVWDAEPLGGIEEVKG